MRLEDEDITIVHDLLLAYQHYINESRTGFLLEFAYLPMVVSPEYKRKITGPISEIGKVLVLEAPRIVNALSGELPPNFIVLETHDLQ